MQSHPTWVRGLKHDRKLTIHGHISSHPTWVRGLKHTLQTGHDLSWRVAPYVGAWIETVKNAFCAAEPMVAPYVGAWIETNIAESCVS